MRCCYEDMKLNELNQAAKRNEDLIACSALLPVHSFLYCILYAAMPYLPLAAQEDMTSPTFN